MVLLDTATAPDGRRVGLLGQGYMPAEDFHVLTMPLPTGNNGDADRVWFTLPGPGESLSSPSWRPFARGEARRFRTPKR